MLQTEGVDIVVVRAEIDHPICHRRRTLQMAAGDVAFAVHAPISVHPQLLNPIFMSMGGPKAHGNSLPRTAMSGVAALTRRALLGCLDGRDALPYTVITVIGNAARSRVDS
jgi:hypothetical protein